jgi:hypothetical protein
MPIGRAINRAAAQEVLKSQGVDQETINKLQETTAGGLASTRRRAASGPPFGLRVQACS